MKCKQLLCRDFNGQELTTDLWCQLDGVCEKRLQAPSLDELSAEELAEVDCLLVKLGAKIDKHIIERLPKLQYIGILGTGYGGIDTAYAASKGITVSNIADYATAAVSEFTFGILLEHLRDITRAKRQAETGDYSDNFIGNEIRGKKFGIIGLGDIGTRTAQLAQAFGADVSYWSRNRKKVMENRGVNYSEVDSLLANSDIITLNLALNSETEGIINTSRIEIIKQQAVFINLSPMDLIDFAPMLSRLKRADMTFMLDHSDEMNRDQLEALRPLDNCIIYPPVAYLTQEAGDLKQQLYADNVKNFLTGRPTNSVT